MRSDWSVGAYSVTSTWPLDSWASGNTVARQLCIFYMCAVWLYLRSTCMCVQICFFISRWCYFINISINSFLTLPDMHPPLMRPQDIWVAVVNRGVLMCTMYPSSVGYVRDILFIQIIFISFRLFSFLVSPKVEILYFLISAFTRSNSAIWSIFDCFISSYFTFIRDNSSCYWSTCLVNKLVSFCCIWKLFWESSNIYLPSRLGL